MQGSVHFAVAILATFGAACATTIDVSIDQRKPLVGDRTWNFQALPSGNVLAPEGDTAALNATLTRLVERCLEARGFSRVTGRPDFYVTYFLEVRREFVMIMETPAVETLQSLDYSPSYEVQASTRKVEMHERGRLTIFVTDPDERSVLWRGGFAGRYKGRISFHLKDAVASLLGRLPKPENESDALPVSDPWDFGESSEQCIPQI